MKTGLVRTLLRLAALAAVGFALHFLMVWTMEAVKMLPPHAQGSATIALIVLMLVLYALLIAVPFVPGVEIGVTLMIMRGAEIAPAVYVGTVTGLMLAFLAGRFLPYAVLHRVFADLRLAGACRLIEQLEPLPRDRRLALLRQHLPGRLGNWAVQFRYLTIAVLLNLPGTTVIGGGGGICLVAGMSRLFSRRGMVITVVLSVAPVPLAVWFFGTGVIAPG